MSRAPLHLPFVLVVVLAAVGLIIAGTMYVFGLGADVGSFVSFFLAVMSVITSFAALVYQLGKADQKLDAIAANTNGTLSAERTKSAALEAQLLQAGIVPVTAGTPTT